MNIFALKCFFVLFCFFKIEYRGRYSTPVYRFVLIFFLAFKGPMGKMARRHCALISKGSAPSILSLCGTGASGFGFAQVPSDAPFGVFGARHDTH